MPDANKYGEFLETVVFGAHLEKLPDRALRESFIMRIVDLGEADHPPFELDYWRLNLQGRRPIRRARSPSTE